jgi:hypothetical protein
MRTWHAHSSCEMNTLLEGIQCTACGTEGGEKQPNTSFDTTKLLLQAEHCSAGSASH